MEKVFIKRDYYGNKSYGKRAFWFVDKDGKNTTFEGANFMFVSDLEDVKSQYPKHEFEVVE